MKKVICINQAPLNPRTKSLSYVDAFIRAGFDYEFWDLTDYFKLFPSSVADQEIQPYVRKYSTLDEIDEAIGYQNIQNTFFFIGVPESWAFRKFFKCLRDHRCVVLRSNPCANSIPVKRTPSEYIKLLLTPGKIRSFIERVMYLYFRKRIGFEYADVFSSSSLEYRTQPINHPDYETFRRCNGWSENSGKYAVFYDAFFPLHPDLKSIGELKKANHKRYLDTMNAFFSYIESTYGLEVVIAAHPISQYRGDEFGNRRIIRWKTCELTKNASMVINHLSNCTSFALLADKPIVFVTTDDVEMSQFLSSYIRTLSSYLGKPRYNLNHCNYDDIKIDCVDTNIREKYIYSLLTDRSIENMTNEEIYVEYAKCKNNTTA